MRRGAHSSQEGQGASLALFRIWRAPAVQALLLQLLAYPLTLAAVFFLARSGVVVGMEGAALVQGAFAAILARLRGLAVWWLAIELAFPLTLLQAQALHIPPLVFLGAFLFLLLLFWSTFRTQVPYYPSGKRVWDEVARLLPQERPVCAIDIGSGLGGLVLELARRRPESVFFGIELAPLPWLVSSLRARLSGSAARFVRGDYEYLDFANYDAVFAYLSPAAMPGLWRKAASEMRPGTILLSYEFLITEKAPDLSIVPTGRGPTLYVWHF
ncbi:MAG: class I SAM-dependent methyltransferase [Massilia sp.]